MSCACFRPRFEPITFPISSECAGDIVAILTSIFNFYYNIFIFREGTGIFLDGNLEYGRTETCKTFQNPPLARNKDFSISVVEVIGFNDTKW